MSKSLLGIMSTFAFMQVITTQNIQSKISRNVATQVQNYKRLISSNKYGEAAKP
uniref:Uncharacterized protein n=1 Tax=Lotus japonicus TaxID=34305 RepID=I3TA92_LOTJA|nr:unknown [Lotus japonicus]